MKNRNLKDLAEMQFQHTLAICNKSTAQTVSEGRQSRTAHKLNDGKYGSLRFSRWGRKLNTAGRGQKVFTKLWNLK